MKKVAIVGVEGSGKTVMLSALGDLYTNPDENGYFLAPKNFGTATYVAGKIRRMRAGEWPSATAGDSLQGLDWTLKQNVGGRSRPKAVCELSFLDFAGEVYRHAFGISSGKAGSELSEQVESLRSYIKEADELIVLINLCDVITRGSDDERVQESMWITNEILNSALGDEEGEKAPRAAIVLSQADSYADTIRACGGPVGVLKKYLPHVANNYGWLDVFDVCAVDKTMIDDGGNVVPAPDFKSVGLVPILDWILEREEDVQLGSGHAEDPEDMATPPDDKKISASRLYGLGRKYEVGKGAKKNVLLAFKYYRAAADAGDPDAKVALRRLKKEMKQPNGGADYNADGAVSDGSGDGFMRGLCLTAAIIVLIIVAKCCAN